MKRFEAPWSIFRADYALLDSITLFYALYGSVELCGAPWGPALSVLKLYEAF